MKNSIPELLTRNELAAVLKLTPRGIESLSRRRVIPFIRLSGRAVRYNIEAVKSALDRMTVEAVTSLPTKKQGRVSA